MLVHLREYEGETFLLVHNLAGSAQAVEMDLSAYSGTIPVELFGESRFPKIRDRAYTLSLGPYGLYWFKLHKRAGDSGPYGIERSAI